METIEKKVPSRKGNRTTEIIVGAAATKLESAVKAITTAVEEVSKLETKVQEGTLKVSDMEDKIGGLEQDYKNQLAQKKIELQQAFDTDKEAFAKKWLQETGMTALPSGELNKLKNELEVATNKVDETVQKAVDAATNSLKATHANELKVLQLEHEKKEASNTAEINQLKSQNKFLEEQVGHWKTMLESQQKNETERAKYGQISTLNVGDPTARR